MTSRESDDNDKERMSIPHDGTGLWKISRWLTVSFLRYFVHKNWRERNKNKLELYSYHNEDMHYRSVFLEIET